MRRVLVLTVAMAVMVALAVPAGATPPSGVNIAVDTSFITDESPFTASGPAVDAGLMCDSGTVHDNAGNAQGFSQNGFNFQGIKHFICGDGSGDFLVNMQARIDFRKGTTFSWNVVGGTGDYEDLRGTGTGVGLFEACDPDCILDLYDGGLHID